jgi:hypothetical protein
MVCPEHAQILRGLVGPAPPRETTGLPARRLPGGARVIPGGARVIPGEARIVPGEARIVPGEARIVPGEAPVLLDFFAELSQLR